MKTRYLFLALVVSGCAGTTLSSADASKAMVALSSAEQVALAYTTLPRCPQATGFCSKQETVDAIKKADGIAYAAVISAVDGPSLATAEAAIAALLAIIPVK